MSPIVTLGTLVAISQLTEALLDVPDAEVLTDYQAHIREAFLLIREAHTAVIGDKA